MFFLKDSSYADLEAVVEFVYKGEVNVAQSQLASFIKTAEMLQVQGLSGGDGGPAPQTPVSPPRHQVGQHRLYAYLVVRGHESWDLCICRRVD